MKALNLFEYLKNNSYPGRGIIIGKSADGKSAVMAYFIMGRSENSRNRIFVPNGDGIKTQAFDAAKMTDPHLIIYSPVRVLGNKTIVSNGDQTDTIYDLMNNQMTFEQALRTRSFEDDSPNYTPRISGIMKLGDGEYNYALSIIKTADGDPSSCERFSFSYTQPIMGIGHLIHTYISDSQRLLSFEGEPKKIIIEDDIDVFTQRLWDALDEDNKISLFVRYINIADQKNRSRIINKNRGVGVS